jgi:ABC-type branched-subunit amino acid transport system ATPase component
MSALLRVGDIAHRFQGLHVLKGVSFSVAEHSVTGLIGPNGTGKSTLFNIISGFLRPISGEIIYMGKPITKLSIQHRSYAGLLRTFQTPQVFSDLTVQENLIAGCYSQGRTGIIKSLLSLPAVRSELTTATRLADKTCTEFGLDAVRYQLAGRLPVGQQRLVELARAIIRKPKLLCLDEPSSGLSSDEVAQLMSILRRLSEMGTTILLVSHDMELMAISSIIHVLCFGEIIATGCMSEIQVHPRVREAYLGI